MTGPCLCWLGTTTVPHSGHCCFDYPDANVYVPGKPLPCGHCVHEYVGGVCRMCGEAAS